LHRLIECKVFKCNLLAWSIYTAILSFITFSFFYLGMRNLKFSMLESLLFLPIAFLGPQMAVWWRLGPSETIGTVFLSVSFFFATKTSKHSMFNAIFFSFFLILSSWCKESFTIIIPAFIFLKIWIDVKNDQSGYKKAIFKNWIIILPTIILILNIYMIIFKIGTNKIGYAGIDESFFSYLLIWVKRMIYSHYQMFFILFILTIVTSNYICINKINISNLVKALILPAIFTILIIAPNIILYSKSGMFERYFLPSSIGLSFLIICFIRETNKEFHKVYPSLILFMLLLSSAQLGLFQKQPEDIQMKELKQINSLQQ
jgi:hypothetical protein